MKLSERLECIEMSLNSKVEVTKIYHGKDHACRCGCCGRYFEKGDKGFTRAINKLNSDNFSCFENQVQVDTSDIRPDYEYSQGWINIPYDPNITDKCYCVYFKPVAAVKESE